MRPAQQGLTSSYDTSSKTNAHASSSSGSRRSVCFLAASSRQHHNSNSSSSDSWTNQDLRNHQPRDREARGMTSLSRPLSKGLASSFPRRRQRSKGDPAAATAGETANVGRTGQDIDNAAGSCRWRAAGAAVAAQDRPSAGERRRRGGGGGGAPCGLAAAAATAEETVDCHRFAPMTARRGGSRMHFFILFYNIMLVVVSVVSCVPQ